MSYFINDLASFLADSLAKGFEIILYLDGNENIYHRRLAIALTSLGLVETTKSPSDLPSLATFHIRSK